MTSHEGNYLKYRMYKSAVMCMHDLGLVWVLLPQAICPHDINNVKSTVQT